MSNLKRSWRIKIDILPGVLNGLHLSHDKKSETFFDFKQDLPNVATIYTDGNYSYNAIFGKKATMQKSKMTNIIENLNSQIRDKISYLVRRSKAHAKSFSWLDKRIAWFFINKNLGL